MDNETGNSICIKATLQRIVYENGDFTIASFRLNKNLATDEVVENKYGNVTIKGYFNIDELKKGVKYVITANEVEDEKYGKQYQVTSIQTNFSLENEAEICSFLRTLMTELQFQNYYDAFRDDLLKPLKEKNQKLIADKVYGMGAKTAISLIEKYDNNEADAVMIGKLSQLELTGNDFKKLRTTYDTLENAYRQIMKDPYQLIRDVKGYGFAKADAIAMATGVGEHDVRRARGFVEHQLNVIANSGSTKASIDDVCECLYNQLGQDFPDDVLVEGLHGLEAEDLLWVDDNRDIVGLEDYRKIELKLSLKIRDMLREKNKFNYDGWEDKIKNLEKVQGWEFGEDQIEGIRLGLENNFLIITGKSGTGKSTLVSGILEVLGDDYTCVCCALSGKASYNISNITGCRSFTMHKLMGIAAFSEEGKIDADIIIIDEVGMNDVKLMLQFLSYVRVGTKVIMLGDIRQLPPIGCGAFLQDCLASGTVPMVNLTKIRRQGAKSGIITCGADISDGVQIIERTFEGEQTFGELEDFHIDVYDDKCYTGAKMIKQFKKLVNDGVAVEDILMLSPTVSRGASSCYSINNEIHKFLIKDETISIELGTKEKRYKISVGDIVLNTKNSYKTITVDDKLCPIYNGETGKVLDIREEEMEVEFNNKGVVLIPKDHFKHIQLGYCLTVHKAQGLSIPYVIMGLDFSSYTLLSRELVYTGITRAKKEAWLMCEGSALRYAIRTSQLEKRETFLQEFLQEDK